jgi:copper chaperone
MDNFIKGRVQKMENGMIKVEGLHSQQDADKILNALNDVWGVLQAEVNLNNREAVFSYDEKAASHQDFEAAIIDSGYTIPK